MARHRQLFGFCAVLLAAVALTSGADAEWPEAGVPGAGTESRQWLPEAPTAKNPTARATVTIQDGILVPMRDGTRLEGRLILPKLSEAGPCVLMSNGYGRTSSTGASLEIPLFDVAARGYAVLHASLRGSGASGGTNDIYNEYGRDGYDLVEWMAKQPWCNGKVGMVGASLLGISQWLTAKEAPPSLKAIVPDVACGDCYNVLWFPGGMMPGPGRAARKNFPGAEAEFPSALAHRDFDGWWRDRVTLAEDHAAIAGRGVAAFMTGGFDDYVSPGNLKAFTEFKAPDARKRLLVGAYGHGWHTDVIQELQIQWLDHWLKGIDNGADRAPKVMIYVKGANRWRYEQDWPIVDAKPVPLYLGTSRSGSIASLNDGSLTPGKPGPAAAGVTVSYQPESGPFLPVMLSTSGRLAIDQRPDEEHAATWTSAPLEVATEVTGYPKLTLWAASSAADADLVAEITDVAPDGSSRQVVQGYMNAPRQLSRSAPKPLTPGRVERYELETFATAYVFRPGHRIRLSVAGGAKLAPNQVLPQGPGPNPNPFALTIYQDAEHPSSLELPIVGTGGEQLTRAATPTR